MFLNFNKQTKIRCRWRINKAISLGLRARLPTSSDTCLRHWHQIKLSPAAILIDLFLQKFTVCVSFCLPPNPVLWNTTMVPRKNTVGSAISSQDQLFKLLSTTNFRFEAVIEHLLCISNCLPGSEDLEEDLWVALTISLGVFVTVGKNSYSVLYTSAFT